MKVTIERSVLLKALGHVHRIVERRNTIPILANVLIEAADGKVALKSTDLDLEAAEQVPADVAQPGATTVPAHVIYDIVRKLPEGAQASLEIAADTGQLLLRSGRSRFYLQALPASDFPDLTSGEFSHRFTLPAVELKRLIDHTQFAISTEETRYYLNGIFLHTVDAGGTTMLRAVATDGHRLARVETRAARVGRHARRHRAAQGGKRSPETARGPDAGRQGRNLDSQGAIPVRRGGADHQADRRHVPRLCTRHSAGQRQAPRGRQGAVRTGGRPRVDALLRARTGDQARYRRQQDDALRQQSRIRDRRARISRSTTIRRRSTSASTRATCSTSSPSSPATRR